jgi:hypothetical protein
MKNIFRNLGRGINGKGMGNRHFLLSTFCFLLWAFIPLPLSAAPLVTDFAPGTNNIRDGVIKYSLWYQSTNEPDANVHHYLAGCFNDQSSIRHDSTNLPNPCLLFVTADTALVQSDFSAPEFFDTNRLTAVQTNALPVKPVRPQILKTHRP